MISLKLISILVLIVSVNNIYCHSSEEGYYFCWILFFSFLYFISLKDDGLNSQSIVILKIQQQFAGLQPQLLKLQQQLSQVQPQFLRVQQQFLKINGLIQQFSIALPSKSQLESQSSTLLEERLAKFIQVLSSFYDSSSLSADHQSQVSNIQK